MRDGFFGGKDFGGDDFRALMPEYYPSKYRKYIGEETRFLKAALKGSSRVLEAGVGIGRLIPELAPIVGELVGVDNSKLMLGESREIAENFSNVKIVEGNLEDLSKIFPAKYFDYSLCIWNTLGNVKNEVLVLKQLAAVTKKSIIVTVYIKGTLKDRERWYDTVGIKIRKIDGKKEIFYSESGLRSKSYSLKDMESITEKSGLEIKNSKVLNGVILWVELS